MLKYIIYFTCLSLGLSLVSAGIYADESDAPAAAPTTVATTQTATQTPAQTATQAPDVDQAELQRILDNWRSRSGIPGATLSIYLPSHAFPLTFTSGTTTYEGSQRINSNTLFQAGSITKSFTSMIILQLEAQGKLNIDDPITNYLPQYPQWQNVTIRELLNHTSGIFNYTETETFNEIRKTQPEAEFTPEEIVRLAEQHRDYFPPGEGWKYSNTNYVLAGMIIQAVTKQPVSDVMNHYLHGDLRCNLINTYYLPGLYSGSFISHMAHGYSCNGHDVTLDNMSWAYTAGAIVTTTQDLLTWWRALFQGNVLPEKQLDEMKSLVCEGTYPGCRPGEPMAQLQEGSVSKGYGLGIIESSYGSDRVGTVWWHNGSTAGYKAIVMWFPQSDIYMALTINRDPGYLLKPDLPIIRELLDVLIPHAEWHVQHPAAAAPSAHHYLSHHKKHSRHHKKPTASNATTS
jgi:D-alanyl-D-alanine carboxypeptidase